MVAETMAATPQILYSKDLDQFITALEDYEAQEQKQLRALGERQRRAGGKGRSKKVCNTKWHRGLGNLRESKAAAVILQSQLKLDLERHMFGKLTISMTKARKAKCTEILDFMKGTLQVGGGDDDDEYKPKKVSTV